MYSFLGPVLPIEAPKKSGGTWVLNDWKHLPNSNEILLLQLDLTVMIF
jgi:hypothetical protein